MAAAARKIGLIVNPIAGMGGSTALKGTDGGATLARARELGAEPLAPARARRALARLAADAGQTPILAAPGVLGADVAKAAGFEVELIEGEATAETSAEDTRRAAVALRDRGVSLILFAGGDGTARDILDAVGARASDPRHSRRGQDAVGGLRRQSRGRGAARGPAGGRSRRQDRFPEAEVMDIDEEGLRAGRVSARLYGYARVPFERRLMQNPKAGGPAEDATLAALCREIAEEMAPGLIYVIGPGTTTQRVLHHLGLAGSLLGVDAVLDGKLLGRDLTGAELESLVQGRTARIILGIIGGQGYSFGRGNQQIGPAVIRAVGRENIILLASQQKILALGENRLLADTGDPAVDALLRGYIRVRLAPGRSTMMRIDV